MDFGVVGLEGIVGSETSNGFTLVASESETKQKLYGSAFLKQERSGSSEDDWRTSKLAKFDDISASKAVLSQHRNTLFRSNTSIFFDGQQQQQMLSFSAPKSEALSMGRSSQNVIFPYFHLTSPACTRNTGYNTGGFNGANMNGGPFTSSQWMELEHQALIYKYMTANVPIPSTLLIPIKKALDSAGFSSFSGGLLRPNTLGWGAFHLGFSNNTDPEPGRCRRTDGKKWRCSRDAVADQKYCERHMNRGRHRSRKPVEGQSGCSTASTTTTTTKLMHSVSSSSASVVGPNGGNGESNSLTIAQQQFKNLQPAGESNLSHSGPLNRWLLNKESIGERMHDTAHGNEFGVVSSESLLNPSHKSSSLVKCINFDCSQDLDSQETESHRSVRQFFDAWPKTQSDCSSIFLPEADVQSDRTQLSISMPMALSDFMSSTSSPNNEDVTHSPLQLTRELDPIQMGLEVGSVGNETNWRQANWIPISRETSVGGPLGEVLHSTNSSSAECKNSSAVNLMTEKCDHSPRLGSSPTGVLQKTMFGSHSNSSAGSSPRAENNKNDLLGSTIVHSSSLPAL
ncbi:growth-regulating factor 1 isoform X2 [Gossypium raimondii]|uniref:growth-regulating factor 1 isoform X2 n=1 Tax=Gossypium raimondii TaxID=29730 RepID=UPI00063B0274|nr:growth-regulating factor 1 isoform X2 [Gossypium raimondii]